MNTLTKSPLENFLRYGIGFDPRFFDRVAETPNYPPHNILQLSDDQYRLTLAVAGFGEDELDITVHNDLLTVTGSKQREEVAENAYLLYSGIAFRDFSRQFKIGDHVYVDNATLKDGLLKIELTRRVPDAMKPKKINISGSKDAALAWKTNPANPDFHSSHVTELPDVKPKKVA